MATKATDKAQRVMEKKQPLVAWHRPPSLGHTAAVLPMRGLCPFADEVTDYDRRNMPLYTWLLIASEDGTPVEELARDVLHFDITHNRAWAIRVTLSHLERAHWVHERCFQHID